MYNSCMLDKGNYLYFRIHSISFQFQNMQNCILAGIGRDQSWHSSNKLMSNVTVANVEYKAYRTVDICAKQAERLCKQYLSINRKTAILQQKLSHVDLNIDPWSCITAITLDFTGSGFDIAQTRWCELYLVATTEYKAHWIFHISAIETEISWFDYLGLIMQNCSCVWFDRTRVDIALIGWYWFNLQEMWITRQIVLSIHFQQ